MCATAWRETLVLSYELLVHVQVLIAGVSKEDSKKPGYPRNLSRALVVRIDNVNSLRVTLRVVGGDIGE